MSEQHYNQELSRLRDLASEFSRAHPALAPMLSGPSKDPDVERILEGCAFLTGLLRQKLEDDFPEVVQGLMRLVFPHYLRPIPSTTILAFTPQPFLQETLTVPAKTTIASIPVDGISCPFQTCYPVEVHPLRLQDAQLRSQPGKPLELVLRLELMNLPLSSWKPKKLRLHLAGAYPEASALYQALLGEVTDIRLSTDGQSPLRLGPEALRAVGWDIQEGLFPYPPFAYPGYRAIQEYFVLPEKFLFLELGQLDTWKLRGPGSRFQIAFCFRGADLPLQAVRADMFQLFATPAINLFDHEADPIALDHKRTEYRIQPSAGDTSQYQVFSVEKVIGTSPGSANRREYVPFESFVPGAEGAPVYTVVPRISPVHGIAESWLTLSYPPQGGLPATETLSVEIRCTNAALPEKLQIGDISRPTNDSPTFCEFHNIRKPSAPIQPPLGNNLLWRLLNHLTVNLLSLADKEALKKLLALYLFPDTSDHAQLVANERRIEGILDMKATVCNRLVRGINMQGLEVFLELHPKHFAGKGDLYLFGCVLDFFLGTYASINCFIELTVKDAVSGETKTWPARIGQRPLL